MAQATIEHVLPQTVTAEWETELGPDFEKVHARLIDTFGNLTLTGYNSELGNIPFSLHFRVAQFRGKRKPFCGFAA